MRLRRACTCLPSDRRRRTLLGSTLVDLRRRRRNHRRKVAFRAHFFLTRRVCSEASACIFFIMLRAMWCAILGSTLTFADVRLIGWSEKPGIANQDVWMQAGTHRESPAWDGENLTLLSWKPRAFLRHGLLDERECEHLKRLAQHKLKRSTVVGAEGKGMTTDHRTSQGMFLRSRGQDEVVERVERKMATLARIPPEHGELLQILYYGPSQEYKAHMDQVRHGDNGGLRAATVLAYLNDVEWGGETIFPKGVPAEGVPRPSQQTELSECARKAGVAVKPRKGDALLFYGLDLFGNVDSQALHAGCPVLGGEKWTATKWIHQSKFDAGPSIKCNPPDECKDLNQSCANWAAAGECESNPKYMRGEEIMQDCGQCMKSCHVC